MDITISDNWLREYLQTKATPKQISEYLSLCGPSIEKVEEKDGDILYHVEITTNRIDCVGVYGFAREAAAILPRFKIPAKLKKLNPNNKINKIDNLPFSVVSDESIVYRTLGVVLTNFKNRKTPDWMQKRLLACGVRSLNAIVDITNYVMLETGHPCHAFDYDKIKYKKFFIRLSKKGEKVTSFDEKTYELTGGDIVFDDGDGEIIDLPGIIGTKNSVVGPETKRVLLFIDNNNPTRIRGTSMKYTIRTMAASINEKGVDPDLGKSALLRGIELYQKVCGAEIASAIYDDYPKPAAVKTVITSKAFIEKILGVDIAKDDITKILTSLEFSPVWKAETLSVHVPSFRARDIEIPEDIVEEIARVYGYFNLPSRLMEGKLPDPLYKSPFSLEWKIKNIIKALGGTEVYTLSLVPNNYLDAEKALSLKNPIGPESKYLRSDLVHSLVTALKENKGDYESLFMFELANVYLQTVGDLPEEKLLLGMCFDGYKYVQVKGILETLLNDQLNIPVSFEKDPPSEKINISSAKTPIGYLTERDDGIIVSEIDSQALQKLYRPLRSFVSIPKHPPQIEDLTLNVPAGVEIAKIMQSIKSASNLVSDIGLSGTYKNSFTFRVTYQNPEKTLTDDEVAGQRNKIRRVLKEKYSLEFK